MCWYPDLEDFAVVVCWPISRPNGHIGFESIIGFPMKVLARNNIAYIDSVHTCGKVAWYAVGNRISCLFVVL